MTEMSQIAELYPSLYDLLGLEFSKISSILFILSATSFGMIQCELRIDKVNLRKTRFPRIFSHAGGMAVLFLPRFEEDLHASLSSKSHVSLYL
jgi:hypothetical protein